MPLDIEVCIDASDPVYAFSEVMDRTDLRRCLAVKESRMGRPKYDAIRMLKIILFSFMENGYLSLRGIEKSCRTDLRYLWLLDGMKAPSHMTFSNFIREELTQNIEEIFKTVNQTILQVDGVDLEHTYIDGTKIEANANKYTWVWKKSCVKNRDNVFAKITELLEEINQEDLSFQGVRLETREEYAVEYVSQLLESYRNAAAIDISSFATGKGHHKTPQQRRYQALEEYRGRLKRYAEQIRVCGEDRNSYSKTDHSATFMRVKRDYMGNDQLLPAYNLQLAVCDGYIAAVDAKPYASDQDCFIPLMEKYRKLYGKYPRYPVADAGYGSYNNYIYCQEHGMEKYMKFTMFEKETRDQKYRENPFRAVNFKQNEAGQPVCPNGKAFVFKGKRSVRGNRYGRTEEFYECEDCEDCPHREQCCKRTKGNRTIRMNRELTAIHEEVRRNLYSIHGALLCMNRSIQAEGAFGSMKWNRSYHRAFRRGIENVILEFTLIAIGFNLYKYHNRRQRTGSAA